LVTSGLGEIFLKTPLKNRSMDFGVRKRPEILQTQKIKVKRSHNINLVILVSGSLKPKSPLLRASTPVGLNVLKRDGSIQPFDKNKLVTSINKAGATEQQANLVSNRVINRLGGFKQPVPTNKLSTMVAGSLSKVNPTASGRYTGFSDHKSLSASFATYPTYPSNPANLSPTTTQADSTKVVNYANRTPAQFTGPTSPISFGPKVGKSPNAYTLVAYQDGSYSFE